MKKSAIWVEFSGVVTYFSNYFLSDGFLNIQMMHCWTVLQGWAAARYPRTSRPKEPQKSARWHLKMTS